MAGNNDPSKPASAPRKPDARMPSRPMPQIQPPLINGGPEAYSRQQLLIVSVMASKSIGQMHARSQAP